MRVAAFRTRGLTCRLRLAPGSVLLALLLAVPCHCRVQAQVFEVGGGNSSLYQAGGGNITMHAAGYELNAGAGTVDGHLLEGVRMLKPTRHGTLVLGDDRIDFHLPTDIFDSSHYVQMRGFGINQFNPTMNLAARGGALSVGYNSPFFNGASASQPAALLFLTKQLSPRWLLASDAIVTRQFTQIEALAWTPRPKFQLAAAGGVGAGDPFSAFSLILDRTRIELQAAYIKTGANFHRIAGASPQLAEPDRDNLSVTLRPWEFLSFGASRNHYLLAADATQTSQQPGTGPNGASTHSAIDQGFTSVRLLGTQLNATFYRSTYDQAPYAPEQNRAFVLSAMRDVTERVHLSANYFRSAPDGAGTTANLLLSAAETLNSRITAIQSLSVSNGNTSANFGGEFLSNRFTASATYQTFYVPAQSGQPFEEALLVDLRLRVAGPLVVQGSTFVDPTGHLRYTVDANSVLSHTQGAPEVHSTPLGGFMVQGCVFDAGHTPFEGAALRIDGNAVYTDSTGCFTIRENKRRTHALRLTSSDFLVAGQWYADNIPATITSTSEGSPAEAPLVITVRRIEKFPAEIRVARP